MEKEGTLSHNLNGEVREIFSEFLVEVVKLEQLVTVGQRFLTSFQQALEFLRRPSIHETSELVRTIIKANETKRVQSYVQAGCVSVNDNTQNLTKLNASLSGLQDHLAKAKGIIDQLESLMDRAGCSLQSTVQSENPENGLLESEQESTASEMEEIVPFMAVIYNMVKQDYVMQEKIVSSLSLKSSTGELDSYCLMWSLRPYVNDDVIHQALRHAT